MKRRIHATVAALGFVLFAPAWAQLAPATTANTPAAVAPAAQQRPIVVTLTQHKVTKDEAGREKLVDASSVSPNDVIEYRAVYKNVSSKPVKQVAANLPLPEGLEYVPMSAQPKKGVQFAPSTGAYGAEPLKQKRADGSTHNLPYNEYRQARWTLDELAPGAEVVVAARAKVEAVVPALPVAASTTAAAAAPASPSKP